MNCFDSSMAFRNSTNVILSAVMLLIVILYDFLSTSSRSTTITLSPADRSDVKSLPFVVASYCSLAVSDTDKKLIVIDSGSG